MPQSATIKSLPRAFRMMEEMQSQGVEWSEDYRWAAGAALNLLHYLNKIWTCGQAERAVRKRSGKPDPSFR